MKQDKKNGLIENKDIIEGIRKSKVNYFKKFIKVNNLWQDWSKINKRRHKETISEQKI